MEGNREGGREGRYVNKLHLRFIPKPSGTRHSYNRQMQQNHATITFLCAFLAMGKLL